MIFDALRVHLHSSCHQIKVTARPQPKARNDHCRQVADSEKKTVEE